jgi:hypothetical protein
MNIAVTLGAVGIFLLIVFGRFLIVAVASWWNFRKLRKDIEEEDQ